VVMFCMTRDPVEVAGRECEQFPND